MIIVNIHTKGKQMNISKLNTQNITENMNNHYNELIRLHDCMKLLTYCLENKIYCDSITEVYGFASVIKNYIYDIKNNFQKIEKEIGIYE